MGAEGGDGEGGGAVKEKMALTRLLGGMHPSPWILRQQQPTTPSNIDLLGDKKVRHPVDPRSPTVSVSFGR